MTRRETLLSLAAQVEAAQGADRELDRLVQEARGFCTHRETTRYVCQSDSGFTCNACGVDLYGNRTWPAFTASRDAAASLVLEGWYVRTITFLPIKGVWHVVLSLPSIATAQSYADTEPRARTAAALRAMAEEAGDA